MRGRRPGYAWIDITPKARMRRMLAKVRKRADGCWEWRGKRFKNGYGQVAIRIEPRRDRYWLAHRLMWELSYGSPGSRMVLHRCDRPWCVRPSHLFLGTAKDNAQDMLRKGRGSWRRGEQSTRAVLAAADVREIRKQAIRGALHRVLAARFGVSAKQITVIVNRQQWKHVR